METKQPTGFFRGFFLSFYSMDFYKEVSTHTFQRAFKALMFLVLSLSFILSTIFMIQLIFTVQSYLPEIKAKLPPITIDRGRVSVDVPQPYYLQLDKGPAGKENGPPKTFLIIDTGGTITSLKRTDASMLLTSSTLEVRTSDLKTWKLDVSKFEKASVTAEKVEKFSFLVEVMSFPFCFLSVFVLYSLIKFILVFSLFIISSIANGKNAVQVAAPGLMNICVYSLYPAIVLDLFLNLWKTEINVAWALIAYIAIPLFFTIQGTLYAGKKSEFPME